MKAFIPVISLISALVGGLLSDYFESERGGRKYRMRGFIVAITSLIVSPCFIITFIWQHDYWSASLSLMTAALVGESFLGCSISMVNNMIAAHAQGVATAFYVMIMNLSLAISQTLLTHFTKEITEDS